MNLRRAHTEILILAVALAAAAILVLSMSVSFKAPEPQAALPQASVQIHQSTLVKPAAVSAAPASLQTVSAQSTGDWVRAETVEAPAKQTRWVF